MFETIAIYSGLIATLWIFIGVYVASRFYEGYSHSKQFCSELGATGSPTEKLSPLINNYPLGFLFCFFGWYLAQLANVSILVNIVGWLVIVHGIGTWVAGYFPMDADPFTKHPTFSCKVHSWAGFIMLLSLVVAPILIAISPTTEITPLYFRVFSIVSVIATVYYLFAMAKAIKLQSNPGSYQRISYGIQLSWLSVFSIVLM
ncbi:MULTISPECIES: DUF998 domain-containing protein [Pseudoalteromonas]|uniref:DUF998 domain-containing protein n=1 Tax=Pseudoalteromonas tetraodonis GFC TaxID=1315271 RepID=A0AA37W3J4_9GAMM|nr:MULTISPECIES: DUF998 domain-containing protein [Pseudoalteromonas]ATD05028.1 hypothetical protein PTET_b0344 [Pseudoalteromonas tetraodonis]GEN37956.1 hypothetical protein PTE01_10660 [Pseudoalteromonas tetraodonis GFC]GLQ04022.1 hypothetical protein GCM10007914_29030 [Pseudoalteromonas tetraodonis GFC]